MDRTLQPAYGPYGPPASAGGAQRGHQGALDLVLPPKGTGDYIRAVRAKWGLMLVVSLAVIVPGSIWVHRRPNVYRATACIRIEPPMFDERVAAIVEQPGSAGATNKDTRESYVPDHMAELKGRSLAEKAATSPELSLPYDMIEDVVNVILNGTNTRRMADSNTFEIYLEWTDRERVALVLNALLDAFHQRALTESRSAIDKSKEIATSNAAKLQGELKTKNKQIEVALNEAQVLTPEGKNVLQDQYIQVNTLLTQKRARADEFVQQQQLLEFMPKQTAAPANPRVAQRLDLLYEQKEKLVEQLEMQQKLVKKFDTDPTSKYYARMLKRTLDELEHLEALPEAEQQADLVSMFLTRHNEEVQKLEDEVKNLQGQIQATMPMQENFLSLLRERESLQKSLDGMRSRLMSFEFLSQTQNEPIKVLQPALEPAQNNPVRPNRALFLGIVVILGLGLGLGTVCLLESLDRRIRVPEHLSAALTIPLLAIVPRLRRLAHIIRGGHICVYKDPGGFEADAFRNLRASLVGLQSPKGGPIVTMLVTSAKPGEGKTTTALNLAATCARSGERTLLMEVDLRRPSLAPVFNRSSDFGLVDALRGELPWQKVVMQTDVSKLDFMPCGDPNGVPIEALSTLEMRQLLIAVSRHYHRVILDGPAILGLADCRILGRLVDAALLVVRCGAHDLSPLRRAKAMLDLSHVPLVGAVFNALSEDLANWSSEWDAPLEPPVAQTPLRELPAVETAASTVRG